MTRNGESAEPAQLRMTVARNIKAKRIGMNLTIAALAQRSGCSVSTITAIEAGRSNARLVTLVRIAVALEIDLAEVFRSGGPGE
jgi:transcriptional regulator with XRE-family HTH domain